MAPFFKKKRQSTLPRPLQGATSNTANESDTLTVSSNGSGQKTQQHHTGPNPYGTPNSNNPQQLQFVNYSSPQRNPQYPRSPSGDSYQRSQYQTGAPHHHYNTANIPPQPTFQDQFQQQQYSRSATQAQPSTFNGSPFANNQQQQRFGYPQQYPQQYHQQQQQQLAPPPSQPQQQQQSFSGAYMQQPLYNEGRSPNFRNQVLPQPAQKWPQEYQGTTSSGAVLKTPPQESFGTPRFNSEFTSQRNNPKLNLNTPWKQKKLYNSPFPRYRHTASTITADNGCFFIMGGLRDDNVYGDIWLVTPIGSDVTPDYSYIAKPIETGEGVPAPRVCHNSILIGNAFIVYGGDTIQLNAEGELDNNLYFFNINSMKWTTPSPRGRKPSGRYGHTITVVTFQNNNEHEESTWSSYLYVFAGQLDDERFNDMWCFDLSNFRKPTTQWRQIYQNDVTSQYQPPPLANHTMTVYDGRIYVYGGSTIGGELSNALYCFNPVDESWSACPYTSKFQLPAVEEHSSVLYQNLLISYGGKNALGTTTNDFIVINLDTFQVFTIDTPEAGSPGNRAGHSLTYDMKNEKLLVMGGDQLNLESTNSSRDDVVFDGLKKDDNDNDLLRFTSIDPASLDYEATYIYEFDLSKLQSFLNKSPKVESNIPAKQQSHQPEKELPTDSRSITSEHPVQAQNYGSIINQEETAGHISVESLDKLDEEEVISSTPLKNDEEKSSTVGADTTDGSIQLARKVSIASHSSKKPSNSHNSGSSVRRVDSINVHKNRRIRSAGSFNTENVEIVNSSRNITPVLKQVSPAESHEAIVAPSNATQDEFLTPPTSSASIFEGPSFPPYQKIGSKVDLELGSDDDDEVDEVQNDADKVKALAEEKIETHMPLSSVAESVSETSLDVPSRTPSFPNPKENSARANIPSAISDATMNSFLDNYTNKAGSFDRDSSREVLDRSVSSGSHFSSKEDFNEPVETPTVPVVNHFDNITNDFPVSPPSTSYSTSEQKNDGLITSPELDKSQVPMTLENNEKQPLSLNTPPEQEQYTETRLLESQKPKDQTNTQMAELYQRLNDLKKSLNEKMGFANDKIVGLELANSEKDQEIAKLKSEMLEKLGAIDSLREKHDQLSDMHTKKQDHLQNIISTHERSIGEHTSLVEELNEKLQNKDKEILDMKSLHTESQSKLSSYELILNDKMMNIEKFNRILQKQKEFVKKQHMNYLVKEENMLKKINELTLENQNLKVECDKLKQMQDIDHSISMDEGDEVLTESTRKVSVGNNRSFSINSDDEDEFNDSSINDLSQGLDKLLATFKDTYGKS